MKYTLKRMKGRLQSGRKHVETLYLTKNEGLDDLNPLKTEQYKHPVRKQANSMNRHFREDTQRC
jgi:hypothetical protein